MNTMDPVVHHTPSQSTLSPVSSTRRRGSRENETPAQRQKREKAAERQRRKRERDRHVNNLNAAMSYPQPTDPSPPSQPQLSHEQQQQQQQQQPPPPPPLPDAFTGHELTPEELARRERVRAAARERQRKHRSLVKQRKMRDLGVDMTGDMIPGMDDVQFRVNGQGDEQQLLPPEMAHPHAMNPQDPLFPHPPLTGGQSFASAVLLSLNSPFIKPQLFQSLSLTHEELPSLGPFIAEAFDQWDHQRRLHFAQQAAKAVDGSIAGPSGPPFPGMTDGFGEHIRGRFQRTIVATTPFRTFNPDSTTATTSTPTSTPGSGPPSDPIDPHLSGVVLGPGDGRQKVGVDADFGQSKDGEGVLGQP